MDRTGAPMPIGTAPIDRRMYRSILAFRNSAVLKSWLFLFTGQLHESCLRVFYRLDVAKAEMVHGKIPRFQRPYIVDAESGRFIPGVVIFLVR